MARLPNARLLRTVAENVLLPTGVYVALALAGVPTVWALVGPAAVSAVIAAAQWRRRGQVSALGAVVAARLLLGLAVAGVTGDPRLVLAKDGVVTLVMALGALATLRLSRPLIARVRRDLDGDPDAFDHRWTADEAFRAAHRTATLVWAAGLGVEAVIEIAAAHLLPIPVAVVALQVLGLATIGGLVAWTQFRMSRVPSHPNPVENEPVVINKVI